MIALVAALAQYELIFIGALLALDVYLRGSIA